MADAVEVEFHRRRQEITSRRSVSCAVCSARFSSNRLCWAASSTFQKIGGFEQARALTKLRLRRKAVGMSVSNSA